MNSYIYPQKKLIKKGEPSLRHDKQALLIAEAICNRYGITIDEMLSKQTDIIVEARYLVMVKAFYNLDYDETKAAKLFGKHRTTMYHAIKQITARRKTNQLLR